MCNNKWSQNIGLGYIEVQSYAIGAAKIVE